MTAGFCSAEGQWLGTAEVYSGAGEFLGNGVDNRHVKTDLDDGRVRIDLSFTGPFKFAGHYVIDDRGTHRAYQGPLNYGFAEAIGSSAVQAHNFWPAIGMSQRFFLFMLPSGDKQLSLALMSRGEQLCYAVVGENDRVKACGVDEVTVPPSLQTGTSFDLAGDPTAGRGELLLQRSGTWKGLVTSVDRDLAVTGEYVHEERLQAEGGRGTMHFASPHCGDGELESRFQTAGSLSWAAEGDALGSTSMSGGRAASSMFHVPRVGLRLWRREVASQDGTVKAIIQNWYQGETRVAVDVGVLSFEPA